jgi:hypothetical protein
MIDLTDNASATTRGVEPALAHALADELTGLTGVLADLAYDLAANAETLRQHMHSLQAIDRITQAQLAMADVLRAAASSEERIAAVTLEELASGLLASLQRYRHEGVPG